MVHFVNQFLLTNFRGLGWSVSASEIIVNSTIVLSVLDAIFLVDSDLNLSLSSVFLKKHMIFIPKIVAMSC